MHFEILLFRTHDDLKTFVASSDRVKKAGISRRILSQNVLLISKKTTVAPNVWGQYKSTGFQSVLGDWIPSWHETETLHIKRVNSLAKKKTSFVEVFRGNDFVIVNPKPST
jgi:hypothetical protein